MSVRALIAAMLPAWLKSRIHAWICAPTAPPSLVEAAPSDGRAIVPLRVGRDLAMFVVPGDIISDSLLATGVWEPELTRSLLAEATKGGLLVEVGANLGYFSLLWANANAENRVIAFEPAPRNIALFQASIDRNGLGRRITLLPVAAGSQLMLSPFDLGPEVQTGWGGVVLDSATAVSPTQVVVVPLDELLADSPHIDVLKIDVEGFDTLVLEGCRRLLVEKRISTIFYEQNHPRMAALGIDSERAQRFLSDVGYESRLLDASCAEVVEWVATPKL